MTNPGRACAWMVAGLSWSCMGLAADSAETRLVATETADRIELDVPAGQVVIGLPKGNLVALTDRRDGSQQHPRYFMYVDADSGLTVSGWFEPAAHFKGFDEFWSVEFAAMKKSGLGPAEPPKPFQLGEWTVTTYEHDLAGLPGLGSTNLRAELIRADTWVDLHLSMNVQESVAESRALLAQYVKSITVREKDGGPAGKD